MVFQYVPQMLQPTAEWNQRHAAIMCISCIAEGSVKTMERELEKVLMYSLSFSLFHDLYNNSPTQDGLCSCSGSSPSSEMGSL